MAIIKEKANVEITSITKTETDKKGSSTTRYKYQCKSEHGTLEASLSSHNQLNLKKGEKIVLTLTGEQTRITDHVAGKKEKK